MVNRSHFLVAAVAASLVSVHAVAAQPTRATRGELGFSYSFMRLEGTTATVGVGLDASRAIARSANNVDILVVGDASVNRFAATTESDAATQVQAMGGVRFAGRTSGGATPFAQVLAGVVSCCEATDPAIMFGVGVSTPIANGNTRFRLQADFPTVFYRAGVFEGAAYDAYRKTGIRVNAGIAIPLGK